MALRYTGVNPRYTTQSALVTVSNSDLSLTLGSAAATTVAPFQGTSTVVNTPRAWSGTIYYGTHNVTQQAGYGWFGPGCPGTVGQSHLVNTTTPQIGGDTETALQGIRARTLVLAPPLDLFNPAESARWAAERIPGAAFVEIPSAQGHQAATSTREEDAVFLNRTIARFLKNQRTA